MPSLSRRNLIHYSSAAALTVTLSPSLAASETSRHINPGLVLDIGPDGRCDDAKVGGPCVIWDDVKEEWRLYYYCRSKRFPKGVAPPFGTGSIAMATSSDAIHWKRFDGPLEGGALMVPSTDSKDFDSQHIGTGNVIRTDDGWVMCYFGGDDTVVPSELGGYPVGKIYQGKGFRCRTGIARSDDGINWKRIRGNTPNGAAVDIGDNIYGAFPAILHTGQEYLLYYSALSARASYWKTRIASSTDLVNWTDRGAAQWSHKALSWERGGVVARNFIKNPLRGKTWLMVYSALDANVAGYTRRIGMAESDDGMTWDQVYEDPIFYPAEANQWDGGGTAVPQLIKVGRNYHLYYYGFAHSKFQGSPSRGIGLAISKGKDFTTFKRAIV